MLGALRESVTSVLAHVELQVNRGESLPPPPPPPRHAVESRQDPAALAPGGDVVEAVRPAGNAAAPWARTPRNAPCPCGSGKKYKHCHGRI